MVRCPHCKKEYEPELQRPPGDRRPIQKIFPDSEPYQREQLIQGFCSDKCWDEYLGVEGYTYDEKGRRFKDGVRILYVGDENE